MDETINDLKQVIPETTADTRVATRPTARQWLTHIALFMLTFCTTTICGIWWLEDLTGADLAQSTNLGGSLVTLPAAYLLIVARVVRFAFLHPPALAHGLIFSASLLAILTAHESGHYLFCRYYGVDATLPFFIPQPPLLIPGTFGAFIRMKSPVPSRRALFDIGLAGPLAGFAVIVPVAFAAILTLHPTPIVVGEAATTGNTITFNDPLLFRLIARGFRVDLDNSIANSFYLAAWVGALVTALNLMPVGQLDGGHGVYAVFGKTFHRWIAQGVFVAMVGLSLLGWLWHGSPAWFLFVILLAFMLRVGHPQPQQMEPLGTARIVIGIITLIVFALCFLPFPITIT
ncbi:MAG TPA: site-2 protease family protein [Pyrinomonadaceae bacterium]|jgi:membrane-associated protease RseP (regulator of RpoE activity)|nr:site-2 protease family protein [Pyrinomonadaceae bacterium]